MQVRTSIYVDFQLSLFLKIDLQITGITKGVSEMDLFRNGYKIYGT